jgi:hypothetical protein
MSIWEFMNDFVGKKPEDPKYRGLHRIEDLLIGGKKRMFVILCEELVANNKDMDAKGIFIRHQLRVQDFLSQGPEIEALGKTLQSMEYDKAKEYQVPEDRFAPVCVPENEY